MQPAFTLFEIELPLVILYKVDCSPLQLECSANSLVGAYLHVECYGMMDAYDLYVDRWKDALRFCDILLRVPIKPIFNKLDRSHTCDFHLCEP